MRTLRASASLLLLGLVAIGAPSASAATVCASADALPTQASAKKLATATVCLVNQERTKRGLKPLRVNRRLSKAAAGHARDMVNRDYFSHDSAGGGSFVDRIKRAGYVAANAFPSLGEDLAAGSGTLGSARAIVKSWMESPGHRANILNRKFREMGIGVVLGMPGGDDGMGSATYAIDFGSGGRR
jgi:uncharacterized protein YkwD